MTISLQAGQLRKRITVQTLTRTADGIGGNTQAWADTVTLWARVEALTGNEGFQAMQVDASLTHRITIRYRTDVIPEQRIKYKAVFLNIKLVRPDELNAFVDLLCEQVNI